MGVDHKGQRFCDHCGRVMVKAVRIHLGEAYCRSCYQTQFTRATCSTCQGPMRAHRLTSDPVCDPCQRAERVCLRCGRLTPRAARLVDGKAVCTGCVSHFNAQRPCGSCGRKTKRLFRSLTDLEGDVNDGGSKDKFSRYQCQSCCTKLTHATCATCRRHRKVVAYSPDRKPLCAHCAEVEPLTHRCPSCGDTVPGGGYANCLPCSLRASATSRARVLGAALERPWCRALWQGFSEQLISSDAHVGKAARVLDASLSYFEQLAEVFGDDGGVTAAELHRRIPSAVHRRHLLAYRYLLSCYGEEGAKAARQEASEAARLKDVLARAEGRRYERLLADYVQHLQQRATAARTVRLYAGVAQSFCERTRVIADHPWPKHAVKAFLMDTPGAANSLSRFVTYCRDQRGWDVRMPSKGERGHDQARAVREVQRLRRVLGMLDGRPPSELKLLEVARVVAAATGVPMKVLTSARSVTASPVGDIVIADEARIEPGHRLYPYALRWHQLIALRGGRTP